MKGMSKSGILVVFSGFSGAGKGSVMDELLKKYGQYALSVSVTTRPPRKDEVEGKDYFFRSEEEFDRLIAEDAFLEYATYEGHRYGTPRAYVESMLAREKDVILEIEIQGAMKIRESFPQAVLIFVAAPSMEEVERRIRARGTESEEEIRSRMRRASQEAQGMEVYDYLLINDVLEECVEELHHIICSEHVRTMRNLGRVESLKEEAGAYSGE